MEVVGLPACRVLPSTQMRSGMIASDRVWLILLCLLHRHRNLSLVWYVSTQSNAHRLKVVPPVEPTAGEPAMRIDASCGSDEDGGVGSFQLAWSGNDASQRFPVLPASALGRSQSNPDVTLSDARYLGVSLQPEYTWRVKDPVSKQCVEWSRRSRAPLLLSRSDYVFGWRQFLWTLRAETDKALHAQRPPPTNRRQYMRVVGILPNRVDSGAPPPPPNHPQEPNAAAAGSPQNVVFVQQFFTLPFTVDLVMAPLTVSDEVPSVKPKPKPVTDRSVVSQWLSDARTAFERRFDATFTSAANASHAERSFAMAALSNLVGGIGYFHGSSLISTNKPGSSGPAKVRSGPISSLYTAVPSRSFFPRGFMWDEGFHQLLIGRWDPTISMDIFNHWV